MNLVIVDDEAIVRHGIRYSVSWPDLQVDRIEEAANGREVLDRFGEWQPDLIITDIIMPVMDGIELIRQVKARKPSCRFIVLSCADDFEYVKEALLLGASDYLLKMTIRPEDLKVCVNNVVSRIRQETAKRCLPANDRYKAENFFNDLLTHAYTPDQIREAVGMYGLRSSFLRFSIAVMQVNLTEALQRYGEDEGWLVGFALVNALQEMAERWGDLDFFRIENDEYALVMDCLPGESLADYEARLIRRLDEIARDIRIYLKFEVRFGFSAVCCGIERLPRHYREAKKAAELHLFRSDNRPIHSRELTKAPYEGKDPSLIALFDGRYRQSLTHAIAYGKEEEALQTIDEHFALLREDRCSFRTAVVCIDKAAALMDVCAMEMNSHPGTEETGPAEEFGSRPFNLYWSVDRTKERLKQYCRYLIRLKEQLMAKGSHKIIMQIQSYLAANYASKITLEQTAKHFHLNKNYLSQLFKLETGVNFTRYLNSVRVEKAMELMMHSSDSIAEIAEKTGFGDFRYFSRVFKRHTQLSPTEFKQAMSDKRQAP
jgi:Response regulator containing CheY-like receiver domain and AraC-type DNA-binding domain